jgi:hypothetical protein
MSSLHAEPRQPFPRFRHVEQQLRIRPTPGRHHEAVALGRLPPVHEPFGDTAELERGEHERRRAAAAPAPVLQQRAGAPITASRRSRASVRFR